MKQVQTQNALRAKRGRSERGSALLIVFVFAAIVAIMLYKELPVAAFEAKRVKEQTLIDRGKEYAHAVKLFVRTTKQYPPSLEALETTNRVRFLRKRFKDPFTGKDDWRLLHAGPNGMLIDSKVNPVNKNAAAGNNPSTGTGTNSPFGNTNASGFGASSNAGSPGANSGFAGFSSPTSGSPFGGKPAHTGGAASNQGFGGFNSGSGSSGSSFGGFFSTNTASTNTSSTNTAAPNPNSSNMAATGSDPDIPAVPRRPPAIAANEGNPTGTAANADDQTSENPNSDSTTPTASPAFIPRGRTPTATDLAANANGQATDSSPQSQNAGGPQRAAGPNPGMLNAQLSGQNTNPGVNSTATTSGFGLNSNNSASSNNRMGTLQSGGIAGVASKAVGLSIKTVNDQENYSLWEFFYDPSKDSMRGVMGTQGGGLNAQTGTSNTSSGIGNTSSPFGNTKSGFGNTNSGFGNTSGGFGNTNSGFGNSNNRGFGTNSTGFGSTPSGSTGTSAPVPVPYSPTSNSTSTGTAPP